MTEPIRRGRVLHRGRPQRGCQVIAVDEQAGVVLADALTDQDGSWELAAGDDALLFARCRDEALGIATARPWQGSFDLDVAEFAPTHEVRVRITGEALPEWIAPQVLFTPTAIDGVDGELLRWIYAPVGEVAGGPLAPLSPEGLELVRFFQAGRWWVWAHHSIEPAARVHGDHPPASSWLTAAVTAADGREIEAGPSGFEFQVDGPLELLLHLAPERGG